LKISKPLSTNFINHMAPLSFNTFSRAIAHIDGDAFFASVEQAIRACAAGRS
jgi:hypothetical protein